MTTIGTIFGGGSLLLLTLATSACNAQDRPFRTAELSGGSTTTYTAWLPSEFDSTRVYPVLICPSTMDRDARESWCWRDLTANHQWIRIGADLRELEREGIQGMRSFLDHLRSNFKVEGQKFHIAGFSANSAPIFNWVLSDPGQFASVTGVPGHPRTTDQDELVKLRGIRIQLIAGSTDTPWLQASRVAEEQLKDLGVEVSLEVISGGGHVLEEVFGDGLLERLERLRVE
jgi:predicted esterase